MKFLISIFVLALLLASQGRVRAQTIRESSELIKELLAAPAPPPRSASIDPKPAKARPETFFDKANAPADDAPIEDLIAYWRVLLHRTNNPVLSDTVRQRLLDAAVEDLKTAYDLLRLLPRSESFAQKIKQALDNAEGSPELAYVRSEIKKWLVFNSKYYLNELLALAQKVNDKDGYVEHSEALLALAKVDWSTAEPLLETLVNNGQSRSATLALTLLYQHSVDKKDADAELKLRSKLQSIVADRGLPGRARNDAIVALSNSKWSGRDEWYLELLNDESLLNLRDGAYNLSPLSTLFSLEADKWIPVMTKLVAGKDRALQQAAARALVRHAISQPRRDAILPVLRWLTEPDWLALEWERSSFVETLDKIDVPESVPGLIWIVENDENERRWAALVLARYRDPRAIPALKKALAEVDEDDREFVLEGLLASGGLTEAEQIKGLEGYATKLMNTSDSAEAERDRDLDGPVPLPVSIGQYLAKLKSPPDSLVRAVFTRAASLRTRNPALSRSLVKIAHSWPGRQVNLDIIERIAINTAEANTIIVALNRRAALRESVRSELHLLLATAGTPKGIGAILLDDNDTAGSILSSSDQLAQIGLLVSARLTQTSLSTGQVGPLLKSKNSLLALVAERYLLAEDSKKARTLLWQHHHNKAFITGWREDSGRLSYKHFEPIEKEEEKLRAELLKPGGPLEIYALLTNLEHYSQVLRVYPDKAVYTFYEDSRHHERVVPQPDLSVFKEFVSTKGLADLGPQLGYCHHNCWVSQFLMLSKDASRRVFSHQGIEKTTSLHQSFQRLGKGEGATTRYNFESTIKGVEVLYGDQSMRVLDVWQRDNEIRVFVERPETAEEIESRAKDFANEGYERAEILQREHARMQARLSWRRLKDKDASSVTTAPDGFPTIDYTRFPFDEYDTSAYQTDRHIQVLSPDSILIARPRDGLWKQTAGAKPMRISGQEGAYANPIVTPDRKWAVIAKADEAWSAPNYLVILNLETHEESRVKLEPNEELNPIAFLPLYEKILVRSAQDPPDLLSGKPPGPDVASYYLIDPKTGDIRPVAGEFGPLRQEGRRFLQPTNEPGQYWAALPDRAKNQTVVGRYNLKDFSFKPILIVPQIRFDSMSMWVDEKQEKLYFVYHGQLLRLPLSQ